MIQSSDSTATLARRTLLAGATAGAVVLLAPGEAAAATRPTLRVGSSGAYVVELQKRLNALGYWCGAADGKFGWLTQEAVIAVQKAAWMSRTGVCDGATWSRVLARYKPRPRTTSGYVIEIDKARQIGMCVANGVVVRTFALSSGGGYRYWSPSSRSYAYAVTPTGTFRIYWVYGGSWQSGPLGSMYRPAYFYRGFAIHGSTSVPTYPASHGCVRNVPKLQDHLIAIGWVKTGRTVKVY